MADAKVIPFDDDRARGGAGGASGARSGRRRGGSPTSRSDARSGVRGEPGAVTPLARPAGATPAHGAESSADAAAEGSAAKGSAADAGGSDGAGAGPDSGAAGDGTGGRGSRDAPGERGSKSARRSAPGARKNARGAKGAKGARAQTGAGAGDAPRRATPSDAADPASADASPHADSPQGGGSGARTDGPSRSGGAGDAPDGGGGGSDTGGWERRLAEGLAFLRKRLTGDYEVDDFGFDAQLTDQVLMSLLRPLYEKYFRVDVKGAENIPAEGGALIVANHSGTLPLDGLMMQVAVHDQQHEGREPRHLRLLAADLVFALPVVNELARKAGHTLACAEDAERLLRRGELVGVMPEGFKGIGKPFGERYKLQRFGRGGFVSTALRTGTPIVPCSIVGAEEIYPMIGNAKTLARLLGFPYFPLTPTFPWLGPLGAVPLPTKWTIQFGEPIPTDGYPPEAADDPMLMFNLTDQVREQIQHTLYKLLVQRRSVFF